MNPLEEIAPIGAAPRSWRTPIAAILRKLQVDPAVVYLVVSRLLQILSFPVTLFLIARHLTPEAQGFYYSFASIQALQIFVELGFVIVIVNTASHEWSRLSLDERGFIVGDADALSRLVSLGRLIFKWYAVAATLFVAGAGIFGWYFFAQRPSPVHWEAPLFALLVVSGFLLWAMPFNALLEGSNQVVTINKLRVSQTILENLALWAVLLLGGGLWAAVAGVAAKLLRDFYLLFVQYRNFFAPFFRPPKLSHIGWSAEIWPMQWRLAIAGTMTYFASSLYNLVMFRYHGAAMAGRMGMTLQMVNGVQLIAMAWVSTRVPRYGMLIARGDYGMLDRLWLSNSVVSLGIAALGSAAIWVFVYLLNLSGWPFATRMLPPGPTLLFVAGAIFAQITQCLVVYLRAHKREPILVLNVVMCATAGLLVWTLGRRFGAMGAATANIIQMSVTLLWMLFIWRHYREVWHREEAGGAAP